MPASGGVVWFKASKAELQFEARVLELLVPLAPDLLPELVATDGERGWLLLRDAGTPAREQPIDWSSLLDRYARLQIAAAPLADELLAAGALDNRPAGLAGQLEQLFPYLTPETARRVRERLPEVTADLGRLTLPPTIDHNDLHDKNVFVHGPSVRILDWGDAAVTHPFMTLSVEEDESARPAYLAHFAAHEDELEVVLRHRILFRALGWRRVVHHDLEYFSSEIERRAVMWLEGRELADVRRGEGAGFR